ncbi:LOW QUALITY PROTEIN: stabilizer of axonemal microtubules 2 [Erpetoichthys calabaricus]|uniref:Stabilizer of axonemal microtubules 2 n=1 Tax=Erpetoichthys calabaricus TaxID=27687 RepID=A0A8C4THT6_ERPCA|nr:LOW QUALITY PROTEIN: stabilizer of axonemal microtubules 2 [Erpetoichthys calabaricus]
MKRKCICEICTCGRHRCPHQPTGLYEKNNQPCTISEYTEKYPEYKGTLPPRTLKPKQEYQANKGRMDGVTTFKSDYIPYEVTRRPIQLQDEYRPGSGNIDLDTTYKMDFNPHKVQPFIATRPKERRHVADGKLEGLPTYKDDYRPWEVSKRDLVKPDHAYQPSSSKFGNSTTFQDDFAPKGLVPRETFKPQNIARVADAPFDGVTSHRLSYIPHQLEPKFIIPKEEYKPNDNPFEDLTIHRRDFRGLPGELSKSFKPEYTKVTSDTRFSGSTEFRDRFQQWPVSLPQVRKMAEYVVPPGHMDMNTTSHLDFTEHKVQPFAAIRPLTRERRSSAPFQGNTTMKEDFKAWEARRREVLKNQEEIQKPVGKFDDMTTFKAHYIPHEINVSKTFKPQNLVLKSSAPFYDGTLYRTEFTPKKVDVCPASFQSPPGYMFHESDNRGHKYFHKLSSPTGSKLTNGALVSEVAVM